jgi:hypothetical protein
VDRLDVEAGGVMAVLKYWDPTASAYVPLLTPVSGTTILSGTIPPTAGIGAEGNFYLDSSAHVLYGPKTGTAWPLAVGGTGGGGGAGASYEQTFASADTIWVVSHNLGTRAVEVNCYDLTGTNEYDVEVDIVDENTVTVHWYYAMSGIARVMS